MTFHAPTGASVAAFVVILFGVVAALVVGVWSATSSWKRALGVLVGTAIWLAFLSIVVKARLETTPFPGLMLFFLASNVMAVVVGSSRIGAWVAAGTPVWALVAFQGFRLPLELVLHDWVRQGSIPETMTWTGANLDIVSGVVALVAAAATRKVRWAAWVANVVGFLLLVNVMRVAVLSSPVPFGWKLDRPLLLALHLPFALIVPVCIAGALAGHLILTRALLIRPARR